MGNFIESYFSNNFTNATSSFAAGMNFTNLVIAIPLAATILLFLINKSRALIEHKYIPSKLFGCQFQSVSLIIYTFSYAIFSSVLDLNYYLSIFILGYIPFIFLAWCIYKECDSEIACKFTSEVEYINNFILTIKDKIKTLERDSNPRNILINGAWGSGKSYMVQKHLLKSIPAIYLSCTDYTDLHELNTALIKNTNNCFIRFLMLLSLSRLIATIGKTELKEYIGFNKVIVFDEFERLVDYNKIDPMHIVSLIQYLNHEKNCICILVANEDHLNDVNQFTNVREKLISSIYHYELSFDEVIKIIQSKYLKAAKNDLDKTLELENLWKNLGFNSINAASKIETIDDFNEMAKKLNDKIALINQANTNKNGMLKFTTIIDLNNTQFEKPNQHLQKWYNLDNNIRMIEHLYIKINQLYQATLQMIDEDEFYRLRYTSEDQKNKLFTGLFNYVDTVIIQLYYLYLKNPYFLSIVGQFAEIYHNDDFIGVNTDVDPIFPPYFPNKSIQNLATIYTERDDYKYYKKIVPCFTEIQKNKIFANINQTLIIDYINNSEFIVGFIYDNEISQDSTRVAIQSFMIKFKKIICESETPTAVIDYFKRLNILEETFLEMVRDINLPLENSVIINYIEYCKYIDKTQHLYLDNYNNIRPVSYSRVELINALVLSLLNKSNFILNSDIISQQIKQYYEALEYKDSSVLKKLFYDELMKRIKEPNQAKHFIQLVSTIFNQLIEQNLNDSILAMAGIECMHRTYWQLLIIAKNNSITNNRTSNTWQEEQIKNLINQEMIQIFQKHVSNYTDWCKYDLLDWIICKMCDLNNDSQNEFIKSTEFENLYNLINNFTRDVQTTLYNKYERKDGIRGEIRNRIDKSIHLNGGT